jgi:hypothetical protein
MTIVKIISFIVTLSAIGLLNYGLTLASDFSFIEISVFVALVCVFIIYFFSSSGGYTSRSLDMQVQADTGIKVTKTQEKFSPSSAFYASAFYLILSLIATFFTYREYFIK